MGADKEEPRADKEESQAAKDQLQADKHENQSDKDEPLQPIKDLKTVKDVEGGKHEEPLVANPQPAEEDEPPLPPPMKAVATESREERQSPVANLPNPQQPVEASDGGKPTEVQSVHAEAARLVATLHPASSSDEDEGSDEEDRSRSRSRSGSRSRSRSRSDQEHDGEEEDGEEEEDYDSD